MSTLEIILIITNALIAGLSIWSFVLYRRSNQESFGLFVELEESLEDIEKLQKANEDFKNAHEQLMDSNQKLMTDVRKLNNAAAMRERYITEVIQPLIFQRRQKFMELDGISYEMFAIVDIVTKYPKCMNIMPVNLWEQISEELANQQAFELLSQMQNYRKQYPTKFTPVSFGECFYRAPLWNLPNNI